jgi:hypothetical protein
MKALAAFLGGFLLPAFSAAVPPFQLEDQFEKPHTERELFGGAPTLLVAGDQRKTGDHIKAWAAALRASPAGQVRLVGLANLDGVPFFVPNSSIRSSLRETCPDITVLCDWKGELYEKLALPEDSVSVSLFDAKGSLVRRIVGEVEPARVALVAEEVTRLLGR